MTLTSLACLLALGGAAEAPAPEAMTVQVSPWTKKVLCRRVKTPPKIDADLSDWDMKQPSVVINAESLRRTGKVDGPWGGDKDSSGVVSVAWDDKYLYLAAKVVDDHPMPLEKRIDPWVVNAIPRDAPWFHDSVMLYFRALGWVGATGRFDDRITVPMLSHPFFGVTLTEPAAQGAFLPKTAQSASRRTPEGYVLEAALPMAAMGYRPKAGDRVRFALILVDPDPGKWGQLCNLWDSGGSGDERHWGELRFVDASGQGGELLVGQDVSTVGQDVVLKAQVDAAGPGVAFKGIEVRGPKGKRVQFDADRAVKPGTTLRANVTLSTVGWPAGTYWAKPLASGIKLASVTFRLVADKLPTPKPAVRVSMTRNDARWRGTWKPPFGLRPAPLPEDITKADYLAWLRTHFRREAAGAAAALARSDFGSYYTYVDGAFWHSFFYSVDGLEKDAEQACRLIRAFPKTKQLAANFHTIPKFYDIDRWLTGSKAYTPEVRNVMVGLMRKHYAAADPKKQERGAMNRSMVFSLGVEIALKWIPDLPNRKAWREHVDAVWHDWWDRRDFNENSTNYVAINFEAILLWLKVRGVEDEAFAEAGIRRLFDRYLWQAMPNGVFPSYGDSVPHNTTWGSWVAFFEVAATRFNDGRYKWVAHRIWHHALSHCENLSSWNYLWGFASARLMSNFDTFSDEIKPVRPTGTLTYVERPRVEFVPQADRKKLTGGSTFRMFPDLMPAKLALRSGWDTQDLAALVDLTPDTGHSMSPVPAVSCLTANGSVLLHELGYIEKGPEYHNVVFIEDLEGIPPYTKPEKVTLLDKAAFTDSAYARVAIENYKGWPVTAEREFFLVGNRLMWVKDVVRYAEPFRTRLGPNWQIKTVGPDHGANWINTYIDTARTRGIKGPIITRWFNPACDLLLYFLPRDDCALEVIDRRKDDPTQLLPLRVRYRWTGMPSGGVRQHFSTLLIPHPPVQSAKPIADTVTTLLDTPETSAVKIVDGSTTEWLVVNPGGAKINTGGLATDARLVYVRLLGNRVARALVRDATTLSVDGRSLHSTAKRTTVDK